MMSLLPIPANLWREYCRFRELYPTCQVILHQHQGQVTKIECSVVIKAQLTPTEALVVCDIDKIDKVS